jgi:glycosyltransferase involved in cell wall biosynthesis
MNIGIVTTWQERGAAYVSRQYRNILNNDHEVFIYARGGEKYAIGDKNWDDKTVTWGKKIPIHMPAAINLSDFKKWILKNKIEVVLFNEQQWWDPVILCNKLGIKTGAYIDYYTTETVPFFALYDFLICNTKRHFSTFTWHPQAVYIPWGIDINLMRQKTLKLISKNFITFFHSSGVSPKRKGTDLLLYAFAKTTGLTKLIIHTQINLIKNIPELNKLIDKLTKKGRLKIINKTVAAPGLYYLGDIYVYPSRLDGIGLSLPEALACGLPVITSDNPPMNEFINDKNGRLIKISKTYPRSDSYYWPMCEPDIDDLTLILQNFIDHPEKVPILKKQAREYAEKNLNWTNNSSNLSQLFNNFKIIPLSSKIEISNKVKIYENSRSNWQTRLYRRFPFLFQPFAWFWPIIKKFYI